MTEIPLRAAEDLQTSEWGQSASDPEPGKRSNGGWGDSSAPAAGKSKSNGAWNGGGGGGWDEGAPTAPRDHKPTTRAPIVSSRESVDWEERAERNRSQILALQAQARDAGRPEAPPLAASPVPLSLPATASLFPPPASQPAQQAPRQQQLQQQPLPEQAQAPPPPNHPPPPLRQQPLMVASPSQHVAPEQQQHVRQPPPPSTQPPPPTQPLPPTQPPPPSGPPPGSAAVPAAGAPGLSAAASSYRPCSLPQRAGLPGLFAGVEGATSPGGSTGIGTISAASPEWVPKTRLAPPPGMVPSPSGGAAGGIGGLDFMVRESNVSNCKPHLCTHTHTAGSIASKPVAYLIFVLFIKKRAFSSLCYRNVSR